MEVQDEKGKRPGIGRGRRLLRGVLVGLILLVVVATALFWIPRHAQPSTPADILDHANRVWGLLAQGAGVTYQKFYLMIDVAPVPYAATAEVWRSADETQERYQMTDAQGQLIYFLLRSGEKLWRSGSLETLSLTPVNSVFPETLTQYQQELAGGQGQSVMLELAAGIDRLPSPGLPPAGQLCNDLKCFLGDWAQEKGIILTRQKDVTTENGLQAPAVKMDYAGDPAAGEAPASCILVIDPESYLMLEYIDPSGNMLHLLDYRGLSADEVPPDLFTSFPPGVNTAG
jgi:hypothetical protein